MTLLILTCILNQPQFQSEKYCQQLLENSKTLYKVAKKHGLQFYQFPEFIEYHRKQCQYGRDLQLNTSLKIEQSKKELLLVQSRSESKKQTPIRKKESDNSHKPSSSPSLHKKQSSSFGGLFSIFSKGQNPKDNIEAAIKSEVPEFRITESRNSFQIKSSFLLSNEAFITDRLINQNLEERSPTRFQLPAPTAVHEFEVLSAFQDSLKSSGRFGNTYRGQGLSQAQRAQVQKRLQDKLQVMQLSQVVSNLNKREEV